MLDWNLYENHFSTAAMRSVWSEQATIERWLEVEKTIAQCQARQGVIDHAVADRLSGISFGQLDQDRLAEDMTLVGRPIVGLVKQIRELVGAEMADCVHQDVTTQDIMDTAMVLQMRSAIKIVDRALEEVVERLQQLSDQHEDTRMIGRTNGQYAKPIPFSLKLQVWISELERRRAAIQDASRRGILVQFGGPVGDLQASGDTGRELKQKIADQLGLQQVRPHWQNARDGIAEIVSSVGLLCSSLCKIAHNVNLLSSSDIAELNESPGQGKGASSSMHHKRNQRASEFAEAVARLARQRAEQINETSLHEHERSGGVWIAEWVVVPEVFLLSSGAIYWIRRLFNDLEINVETMASNLEKYDAIIEKQIDTSDFVK